MKLHIIDEADPSVGWMPREFTIDCPFEREDVEESQLEAFKLEMLLLYSDHADGKLIARFDYEVAERESTFDSANPDASVVYGLKLISEASKEKFSGEFNPGASTATEW
jgi:hypothetical protein